MMTYLFGLSLVVIFIAVFLFSDADFALYASPSLRLNAFDGQVIWITGASSGIGASLTRDLVRLGAQVWK
jgi:hypothetical protein